MKYQNPINKKTTINKKIVINKVCPILENSKIEFLWPGQTSKSI